MTPTRRPTLHRGLALRRSSFNSALAVAGLLALAACASTPPPYQPASAPGGTGYSSTQIEQSRYRVTYRGRTSDTAAEAADLALLRAAELTLQNGYDWFEVVNRTAEGAPPSGGGGPRVSVGLGGSSGSYGSSTSVGVGIGFGGGGRTSTAAPVSTIEVIFGRGDKPAGNLNAYDARELDRNLRMSGVAG